MEQTTKAQPKAQPRYLTPPGPGQKGLKDLDHNLMTLVFNHCTIHAVGRSAQVCRKWSAVSKIVLKERGTEALRSSKLPHNVVPPYLSSADAVEALCSRPLQAEPLASSLEFTHRGDLTEDLLSKLPSTARELVLRGCELTGTPFASLPPTIGQVSVIGGRVSDEALSAFPAAPGHYLTLKLEDSPENSAAALARLRANVSKLSLCQCSADSLGALSQLPNSVKTVDLDHCCELSLEHLAALPPTLDTIIVESDNLTQSDIESAVSKHLCIWSMVI